MMVEALLKPVMALTGVGEWKMRRRSGYLFAEVRQRSVGGWICLGCVRTEAASLCELGSLDVFLRLAWHIVARCRRIPDGLKPDKGWKGRRLRT